MNANNVKSIRPKVEVIRFPVHGDERGSLIALEGGQDIPFEIHRVYYIYGTKQNVSRGFHAHHALKQMLVAVSGSVTITCEYSERRETYLLDSPGKGLLVQGLVWRELHGFSPDCVLLVLASEHYREEDYIRDYNVFRKEQAHDTSHVRRAE